MSNKLSTIKPKTPPKFGEDDIRFALQCGAIPIAHERTCWIVSADKNTSCTCGAEDQAYEVIILLIKRAFQILKPITGQRIDTKAKYKKLIRSKNDR